MKTLKIGLFLSLISFLPGCGDFEIGTEKFEKVKGPKDGIPYEALGGGKLAFDRENNVFIIDADAKRTWGIKGYRGEGVLSPDGTYVALERTGSSDGPGHLVLYNIGSNSFTKIPGSEGFGSPGWTADSKYVLCVVYGETDLSIVRQFGTGANKSAVKITTFTRGLPGQWDPPAVTSMVSASVQDNLTFSLNNGTPGNYSHGIFTIKSNGTGLTEITSDTVHTATKSPCWSPNGEQIAYIHFQWNENSEIQQTNVIIMNSDGSNVSTLATFDVTGTHSMIWIADKPTEPSLTWSPDGTRLAFNMFEGDGVHVYVMKVDGSGLTKVTSQAGARDSRLSWSR